MYICAAINISAYFFQETPQLVELISMENDYAPVIYDSAIALISIAIANIAIKLLAQGATFSLFYIYTKTNPLNRETIEKVNYLVENNFSIIKPITPTACQEPLFNLLSGHPLNSSHQTVVYFSLFVTLLSLLDVVKKSLWNTTQNPSEIIIRVIRIPVIRPIIDIPESSNEIAPVA